MAPLPHDISNGAIISTQIDIRAPPSPKTHRLLPTIALNILTLKPYLLSEGYYRNIPD